MKKTLAILLTAMLLTMSSCTKPVEAPAESKAAAEPPVQAETDPSKAEETPTPEPSQPVDDDMDDVEDGKDDDAQEESAETYSYPSTLGFTLTLPDDWKEDVVFVSEDGKTTQAYFKPDYDDAQKDDSKPWGKLFWVQKLDKEADKDRYQELTEMGGPYELIDETETTAWFWMTATDADTDVNNQERFEDFTETFQEINAVKKSFALS